jgi:hypothetical protein
MRQFFLMILTILMVLVNVNAQNIKSPEEFLGYELGSQFTYHHMAVEYFKYISEVSPNARFREYGKTYEGRPLCVCIVSSEENLANLEELRKNNLIKTGMTEGTFTGKQIPFIWLAYNVHGNESAGMETAMKTLYTLVTGSFPGVGEWLKSFVIIIDPCQNPDGRDQFTERFRTSQNLIPNADRNAWEHNQGWPGTRTNHYLFDLNRDWTWQTQIETRQRIALYQQFMPQVYADFHEMGPESTFFFAPGANPWHEVITPWQHEFHRLMGNGNADFFNEQEKLYFTGENFDLFCPSFGDTWPLFNGAMGFTYEQGGSGFSGLAMKQESGDTITLKKRIDGHFTASMATLKVSFENKDKLVSEFNKFFKDNKESPVFKYKSVIIKGSNDPEAVNDLLQLLKQNQIQFGYAGSIGKKFRGFDYFSNSDGDMTVEKGDVLISAYQPESRFMEVLFEPDSKSSDSLSYDLTAWALPYAYNLKAYALTDQIKPLEEKIEGQKPASAVNDNKPYAYIVNFTGFNELKLVSALLRKGIKARYSLKPFIIKGSNYNRGTIIIARGDNLSKEDNFDRIVKEEADKAQVRLIPVSSGMVDKGKDLGSEYSPIMRKPDVAVLCGNQVQSGALGEIWYFFERDIEYPVTLINCSAIRDLDLSKYNTLILPPGNFSSLKDTVFDFIRRGGRVIAIDNSISIFSSDKSTLLNKASEMRTEEQKAADKKVKSDDLSLLKKFEDSDRIPLSDKSAGSIYRVSTDTTNPFAFGLGDKWFMMMHSQPFPFIAGGNNIGYILDKEPVSGFAGYKYKSHIKNTLVIGSESIGKGEVVYIVDDPYYRAFWKSGRILLGNVIFR